MTTSLVLSAEQWIERLNGKWSRVVDSSVCGFVELGRDLLDAKDALEHGEWQKTLAGLSFNPHTARIFMRIATWVQSVGIAHAQLPPDYTTIDKLTRLSDSIYTRLLEDGVICPTLKRNEVAKILRLERIEGDEKRILSLRPRPGKYRTLVVDPAWDYDWLSTGTRARIGYACQTIEQLRKLDLKQWAEPDCHLYCWSTNNFIREACNLVERWGFQNKTVLTWVKPPPFGMGNYFRNSTEHVIFATLGDAKTRPEAASIPTHFFAPRGEHSEKPEEFYEIVRAASYPPYGEANQRKARPDFTDLFMAGEPLQAAV